MNINEEINNFKKLVIEVTSHFHYTKEEIAYLTIAGISIWLIDPSIEDLILESLATTYFYFTDNKIIDEYTKLMRGNISDEEIIDLKINSGIYFGYSIKDKKLDERHFIMIHNEFLVHNMLDKIIHELKHRLNEIYLDFVDESFYSGLALVTKNNGYYYQIDEAFNSYLTKIYLDALNNLKQEYIEDKDIKKVLDEFILPKNYKYCYQKTVEACLPLFTSPYLFNLFYNACLYKDMLPLYKALEEVFYFKISAEAFFELCDEQDYEEINYIIMQANKARLLKR